MYSLVFIIAILVNRAVLLEIFIPAPGLIKPIVVEPTAQANPTSNSVIINKTFFFSNFQTSFYNILYHF